MGATRRCDGGHAVSTPERTRPSPRPRPVQPEAPASALTPTTSGRSRLDVVWYHVRIWSLAAMALIMVAFMLSAILLSNFPRLGGELIEPLFRKPEKVQRDYQDERQRWPYIPEGAGMNPVNPGQNLPASQPAAPGP